MPYRPLPLTSGLSFAVLLAWPDVQLKVPVDAEDRSFSSVAIPPWSAQLPDGRVALKWILGQYEGN